MAGPSDSLYSHPITSIYGSVTTADVATSLKAVVAAQEEAGGHIAINDEDIRFVGDVEDPTRVKRLGQFDIEISIKGLLENIVRQVHVLAEEDAPVDIALGDQAVKELAAEEPSKERPSEMVMTAEAQVGSLEDEAETLSIEAEAVRAQAMRSREERRQARQAPVIEVAQRPSMEAVSASRKRGS